MTDQARENSDDAWNWSERAAKWRHWHPILTEWWQGVTDLLIRWAEPASGMRVLDLASGTGEPALSLAPRVGPDGTVTATDVIPEMVAIAVENATEQGITNMRFQQADAGALPFPDASFDRVTCRFGVMYFPDVPRALGEVRRVLRPGGRAVFAVWGPLEQIDYLTSTLAVLLRYQTNPPLTPDPDAPHPLKFAPAGKLSAALRAAGFAAIREEMQIVPLPWPGTPEEFLGYIRSDMVTFDTLLLRIPPVQQTTALDEVFTSIRQYDDGECVQFSAAIIVASATRET
ncbi:MAG: class I SAM-dependent methyltransferase [Chloroflexota bacterium]|nr:class I SAM-dependent methyltransferase [Chloroflexota bacterium]